jgi:drug/metabolite transporter (DMT)-like permease
MAASGTETGHQGRAYLALLFTTLTWGVTPVFVRAFSLAAGPVDALVIRTVIVGLIFAAYMVFTTGFSVAPRDWPRLLTVSLAGVLGYFVFSVFGFVHAPAGIGTLIMSTQPLLIAIFARFAGTETLTPATIIGLLVSFAGSILLVSGDDLATSTSTTAQVITGCVLIFFAGVCWAIFVVFSRSLIREYGSLKITGLSSVLIVPPVLLMMLVPQLDAHPLQTLLALDSNALFSLAFLSLIGATVSVITWNYAAGILKPSMLGAALYVIPVLAVLAGWAMLGETITIHILIAAIIILAGVAISQFRLKEGGLAGLALVIFAVTMWGMVPVGMRFLLLDVSPQAALILRIFPAGILAAMLVMFLPMRRLGLNGWLRLIAAALIGNMGYQILAAYGIQLIPASWTGMLFGLEPVFIALGASLFASERITPWFIGGLIISLAGTAVLVLGSASGTVRDVSAIGVILVTISTMGWAIYTITIRPISKSHGAFATACLALAVSAMPTVLLASPQVLQEIATLSLPQWGTVAFLSIFATVLATGAWNVALGHMDSSRAGMFLYVQPVVAAAGGILLLGEELSPWLVGGGVLILAGVAVSQFTPKQMTARNEDNPEADARGRSRYELMS